MPPKKAAAKGKGKRRKDESEDESDFEVSDGSDEEFVETQPAKKCRGEGKGKGKNGGGRGRSGASGSGSGKKAPVDVLVGRLARADLEKLVLRSIQENAPPTLKDIEACLEPDKLGKYELVFRNVEGKESLVEEGPFQLLDKELTIRILGLLNLPDRLMCVSEVCKGWRSIRQEPSLWRSMEFSHLRFSDAGLQALLLPGPRTPLPSPDVVEHLSLMGNKDVSANTFKKLLKTLTGLTHLSLSGKKLSETVIGEIARGPGKQLVHLEIGLTATASKAKPESFLEIFSSCSKLESLSLAIHISDPQWFSAARDRAKLARGGGASLVRKFTVGADPSAVFIDWDSGVAIPALSGLGNAFPELEELRVSTVYPREFWLHFGFGGGGAQGAWAPLPRLRLVEINGIGVYFNKGHISADSCNTLLTGLATAAASVRVLRITRGNECGGSVNERKKGWRYKPLPRPTSGLASLLSLQQIEELSLGYMRVDPADCSLVSLPSLTKLSLFHCGSGSAAAALKIAAGAPKLRSLILLDVALSDEGGAAPGPGINGLLPAQQPGAAAAGGDEGEGGDELAAAAAAGLQSSPLASLVELHIGCGKKGATRTQLELHSSSGSAAADPPAAYASVAKALASRRLCPALRSLTLSYFRGDPAGFRVPPCFDPAHPWPLLESLTCEQLSEGSLSAVLKGLNAPQLTSLALPGISRGGTFRRAAKKPTSYGHYGIFGVATKEALEAYEAVRASGRCPKLPELREEVAATPPPEAAEGGGEEGAPAAGGAAGGADDDVVDMMDD